MKHLLSCFYFELAQVIYLDDQYFIFTCADHETYRFYYHYFADQPTQNNTLDCPKKKLSYLHLAASSKNFIKHIGI